MEKYLRNAKFAAEAEAEGAKRAPQELFHAARVLLSLFFTTSLCTIRCREKPARGLSDT